MSSKYLDIAYIVQEGNSPYILISLEENWTVTGDFNTVAK
ncbi:hypothetical protein ES332_A10G281700v1 [Gossypium tomentosum]|uniref:Uncharacterized protein n=1 Tax=Gossypium tomentosum TaxID=34277 RepID=A0A5D2NXL4_GOSTO|nr:hypothetical protein ES332_A10G281700v1 [Gossypium tomentosum]